MAAPRIGRRSFALGLLVTAGLQGRAWADARVQHDERALMGTRVRITLAHPAPGVRLRALSAAWARMGALADAMNRYRADSAVRRLAAQAGGASLALPPEVMAVLQAAQAASAFTEGAFDATVGAYRDWHFGDDGAPPHVVEAARLRAQSRLVGWRGLELDAARGRARLARPGMALDLGGIAKLPILEAGLDAMRAEGVSDAMVDGGGDVLCRGSLLGRAWRVGVRDPRAPERLAGIVTLGDGVVASSGDYERFFDSGGRRWHHVLDPRTGMPTEGVHGVALLAREIAAVNGLGAAIMVGGLERGRRWLARRPEAEALVATNETTWLSPGFAARLQPAA